MDERHNVVMPTDRSKRILDPKPEWVLLPRSRYPRWYVPRRPGDTTRRSFLVYHPVTLRSRVGWEVARWLAVHGGFRFLRPSALLPREVWDPVASLIPRHGALAVAKANHPGRFLALVVEQGGELRAFVKIARDSHGCEALQRERWALETLGVLLPAPLVAPRVLDHEEGVLVLEPVEWRARMDPWRLPPEVAHALGKFFRATATASDGSLGATHGDCTPWNLLQTESGWTLVDWEDSREGMPPFFDAFHFFVQASVELRRPTKRSLVEGLDLKGWVGASIEAYAAGCEIDSAVAKHHFSRYLEQSAADLDPGTPRRAVRIRRKLSKRMRTRASHSDSMEGGSSRWNRQRGNA